MICKDSVLTWFKGLSSHDRIDLMCSLLNKCLPFELRFIGTCLEDLGRQDFSQMKDFEVKANNAAELSEFKVQCIISDTRTRQKLAVYVCLLHSLNTSCSTLIYKSLYGLDLSEVVANAKSTDSKILEELLTIYTIAVNHPAFSFEQRSNLGSILLRLKQEENRFNREKYVEIVNAEYSHSTDGLDGLPPNLQPGLAYPPGLGSPGSFVQFPVYSPFPPSPMPHPHPIVLQFVNYQPVTDGLPTTDIPPPYTVSPMISRTTSPSQSTQHSRAGSPSTKTFGSRNEILPKVRPSFVEPLPGGAKPPCLFRHDGKDGSANKDNQIHVISERLGDLSTEEMLRGAVASLNGITGSSGRIPPLRHNTVGPPFDPEVSTHGAVPFTRTIDTSVPPPGAPAIVRNTALYPSSRLNQKSVLEHNSHGNDDARNCSSSSGSDASSTSHSPPITPANAHHSFGKAYDQEEKPMQPKPRVPMGRGRGRSIAQGLQNLPQKRVPFAASARRDGPRSAPQTPHEEKKSYLIPPPSGDVPSSQVGKPVSAQDMNTTGVSYSSAPFVPGPFTAGAPFFTSYAPTFVRPSFSYPNGDVLYTYQPQPPPYLPSPLVTYTSSIPPPKIACYNCSSQSHHPNECKEPTMEEYSSKGQYRIDYGKMNEMLTTDK